jgi:hypothetical protein
MKKILAIFYILVLFQSCTKLDENVFDQIPSDEYFKTEEQVKGTLTTIYDEIRGDWNGKGYMGADRGWYDINELTTDECMLPVRNNGADWQDGGIWMQLYKHQWTPDHPFFGQTWEWLYRAINRCNQAVELLEKNKANSQFISEAKVLRSMFYYMLMDGWGNVPIVTTTKTTVNDVKQSTRRQVFDFVVQELKTNVPNLSTDKSLYGRFTKGAGYALLAKIYLNSEVYTKGDGDLKKYTEAIAACDSVINLGYDLVPTEKYFATDNTGLFGDVCNSTEVIYAISIDATKLPRNIIGVRSLRAEHGQALTFGKVDTWGGSTAHQDFINKYEDDDIRKLQWVSVARDRNGNVVKRDNNLDLIYNLEIPSLENAGNFDGLRNMKFNLTAGYPSDGVGAISKESANNDFPVIRFADVLLMKAEAILRNGAGAGDPVQLVNRVRNRAGLSNLSAVTLDEIYDERGREFCWEGLRRQDMIRFGKFLQPHDFKTSVSDSKYLLFPKSPATLANNKNLTQSLGY